MGPDALADPRVQRNVRDLEAWVNDWIRALAKAGGWATQVTGIVEATELDTTAQSAGCGPVPRTRQSRDTCGHVQAIDGTVSGWKLLVVSDAGPKISWAAQVGPSHEPAVRSMRALVTPAGTNLAGHARRQKVVLDRGFGAGVDLGWLAPRGSTCVVPAKDHLAVTADARAQAARGEGSTVGRRVDTARQGPGKTAWTEGRATAVVGIHELTTEEPYGTPDQGRHHTRRDCQPHRIQAVVVRQGQGRDDGPGGKPVFLTNAAVAQPWQPFDADDDRRLIEHGGLKASTQPWRV
jgi:hypothetical protein